MIWNMHFRSADAANHARNENLSLGITKNHKFSKISNFMKFLMKCILRSIFRLQIFKFPMLTHVCGVVRGSLPHGAKHSLYACALGRPEARIQGWSRTGKKISSSFNFRTYGDMFIIFQVSFRARQQLKNSSSDAVQAVIKESSRFERFNGVQKTNSPWKKWSKW